MGGADIGDAVGQTPLLVSQTPLLVSQTPLLDQVGLWARLQQTRILPARQVHLPVNVVGPLLVLQVRVVGVVDMRLGLQHADVVDLLASGMRAEEGTAPYLAPLRTRRIFRPHFRRHPVVVEVTMQLRDVVDMAINASKAVEAGEVDMEAAEGMGDMAGAAIPIDLSRQSLG